MKKRTILAAALALALLACAGGSRAYAYFTTYAEAQGGYVLELGDHTEINEEFYEWTKHVTITSEEDSVPVYVRARAFGPEKYPLEYSGDGWTLRDDGWYYYDAILNGGESTNVLDVHISHVPQDEAEGLKEGDNFNVVVVYESTKVRYDENGDPYADWDQILREPVVEGGDD